MAVAKKADTSGSGFFSKFKSLGKRAGFFRDVLNELKKVHWPTRQQLLIYTGVVFVAVAIVALLIWIVDSSLTYALNFVLQ